MSAFDHRPTDPFAAALGGGATAALILRFDWSGTLLGPIDRWPASLKTAVALVSRSPAAMALLWGVEGTMVYNDAYAVIAGARHPAALGSRVRESWPEIADFNDRVIDAVLRGNSLSYADQDMVIARNGGDERVWFSLDYSPVTDDSGTPAGVLAVVVETSARVRAERAVVVTEARNRQILDSAIDYAIVAFDLAGRITRWNEGARRVLGWTEQEMLGRDAAAIFTSEDRAAGRMEHEMHAALTRQAGNDERWHVRKSGERFWASGEMTPIRDDTGEAIGFVKVLRDRTEQHRAAEALRRSEARLRRAQEAGGVGTFSLRLDTDLISGTREFYRIFGLEATGEVPMATLEALVLPEDARVRSSPATRHAATAPLEVEYRIRRANDGALRWIARKAEFERDAEGRAVRLVGAVQDVTERKADQRAIEESAAQFSTFAQALPNHVWTALPDGSLDWFNDRVHDYAGATLGGPDGPSWQSIVHPDDRSLTNTRWATALATGAPYETEFRLARADGEYRWFLARAVPIRTADGAISRWVGTNTDIHENKLVEAETTRDRERIWTSINDLMATTNRDAVLRATNPAWGRLLGYRQDELASRPFGDVVDPQDLPKLSEGMAALARGEVATEFELRLMHKDQRRFLIAWTVEHVGDFLYLVGRNITEQRSVEEALRQSQKMEAVGQLTGGIAHDFNNLLQGITGSLTLVRKLVAQGRTSEIDRFVDGAMASARRAAALTHRLLAFSRRQPLDPRPVEVNPLVASMEDLLHRSLGERVRLQLSLGPDLWLTKCDPNQLENAILNLAINSRDAMPDGGVLTIETANVALDNPLAARQQGMQRGRYVCISVSDTGIGMSPDTISKAFEPFFTTKPIGQGTGLGLSMIYGFARQSDGYAKIYSEVGQGTSVKLYLPLHRGTADAQPALPALSEAHTAGAGETVLVVEDEPLVRTLIVELMRELHYHVLEAGDGPAGLTCLQSAQRIDLLITDIGLPGLNGRQIAEAARLTRPGLKVLFMTGYAENAAMAAGFLTPGMAMITKPFAMEALATKVREVLSDQTSPEDAHAETERQAELDALSILDSEQDQAYDDLTRMAAQIFGVDIALISLVDRDRQWFKSRVGLLATETPREFSFCAHAIREPKSVFVIRDASLDPRFAANPLVTGDPGIRFYAGAPLVTSSGHAIGTLCAIGQTPQEPDPTQLAELQFLAEQVIHKLEARRRALGLADHE